MARPLTRIDVPVLVMHVREYETEELQEYYQVYNTCVDELRERTRDVRLRRAIRVKARKKLRRARRERNKIRTTLLARNAELEPEMEEWE